jgi:diguanylate cyclase (GGDEF)-like protein/PAS domain S-box-containing protein
VLELRSAMGFPIFIDDKILAVLEFFTHKKLKKDAKLLQTFSTLSTQLEEAWKKRLIEQQIEKGREQNQTLLQAAGEGIYGVDLEGKTTFVNPAAAQMLGHTEEELLGKPMHMLIHHSRPDGTPYPQGSCPIYNAIHDGSVHQAENEVLWRKDGTSFPIRYTSTPIHDNNKLVGAVITFNDTTLEVEENNRLKGMAQNDYLTNLYNRFHFDQALSETISHAERTNTHFSVLYLDLDGFKNCNDTFGHKAGDMVLIQVAERLKALIRGHDIIARIGGDEFAIIMLDINNEGDIRATASRITKILSEDYSCLGNAMKIGVSIGVALYPTDSTEPSELTEFADKALYAAKNSGKNQYKLYNELS